MSANGLRFGLFLGTAASLVVFQQTIPIRQLSPAEATTADVVGLRSWVYEMSDGRVLLNDQTIFRPQLILFDAKLANAKIVADSNTLTRAAFRTLPFGFIPYRGDTTLLADPAGNTLFVLDPSGKNVNVMTMPRPTDVNNLRTGTGSPGFDAQGRLIYRGTYPRPPMPPPEPGVAVTMPTAPDTFALVRADFASRALDTLATVHASTGTTSLMMVSADRKITTKAIRQPYPTTDDWAVLSDGTIAIVRGNDYHIDWIYADGSRASTPKMAFDWRRITLEDKQHIIDSLHALDARMEKARDSMYAARGQKAPVSTMVQEWVPAAEIPDYYPPIRAVPGSGLAADRDRNLWVLPSTSSQARGGLLYDVVNQKGVVFERVQLPAGCTLAGFGAKSRVYLSCLEKVAGDTVSSTHLKRVQIIR